LRNGQRETIDFMVGDVEASSRLGRGVRQYIVEN
jgi:hypothetical protein